MAPSRACFLALSLLFAIILSSCGGGASQPVQVQSNTPSPITVTPPPTSVPVTKTLITATVGDTIALENQKTGDSSWQIAKAASGHRLEGFASASSVNRGGSIKLYVNTVYPSYNIDIYRMGWYGGSGARHMAPTVSRTGTLQKLPTPDPVTGLAEADWTDPYTLDIPGDSDPTNWCSGVYLAKLSAGAEASYIIFIVRDDQRHSNVLFQIADSTYQAYNAWLGKSLYANKNSDGVAAVKVSFNRPYLDQGGSGLFFSWEYPMIRFLESEGADVSYSANEDTHEHPLQLLNHEAFINVGHDEYWTWQMRDAIDSARNSGVNFASISADNAYWQIRLEKSQIDGTPDRVMVGYKENADKDPYATDGDPTHLKYVTTSFDAVGRSQESLTGLRYIGMNTVNADLVISDPTSVVYNGMGVAAGDVVPGIVSGELGRAVGNNPPNLKIIAHSPVVKTNGVADFADTVTFEQDNGAFTFAAGNFTFSWGLDDTSFYARAKVSNERSRQMMRNLLVRLRQHY